MFKNLHWLMNSYFGYSEVSLHSVEIWFYFCLPPGQLQAIFLNYNLIHANVIIIFSTPLGCFTLCNSLISIVVLYSVGIHSLVFAASPSKLWYGVWSEKLYDMDYVFTVPQNVRCVLHKQKEKKRIQGNSWEILFAISKNKHCFDKLIQPLLHQR